MVYVSLLSQRSDWLPFISIIRRTAIPAQLQIHVGTHTYTGAHNLLHNDAALVWTSSPEFTNIFMFNANFMFGLPESFRMKSVIPEATLSQNAAVDETVLHGASLNITAYVVNTEPSQIISR